MILETKHHVYLKAKQQIYLFKIKLGLRQKWEIQSCFALTEIVLFRLSSF